MSKIKNETGASPVLPSAEEENPIPLAISAYALPERGTIDRCQQKDGSALWAIRDGGFCLNNEGEWESEPMPSSRDDEFLQRCRFKTARAAYEAWLKALS